MDLDFETVQRPGTYLLLADAIFWLPKASIGGSSDYEDVDYDIPTYFRMEQELTVCFIFDDDHCSFLAMPAPKNFLASQRTDTYCQRMLKLMADSDPHFKIGDGRLVCREAPIDLSLQVIVP